MKFLSSLLIRQQIGHAAQADAQSGGIVQHGGCGGRENAGGTKRDQSAIEANNKPVISCNAPNQSGRDPAQTDQLKQVISRNRDIGNFAGDRSAAFAMECGKCSSRQAAIRSISSSFLPPKGTTCATVSRYFPPLTVMWYPLASRIADKTARGIASFSAQEKINHQNRERAICVSGQEPCRDAGQKRIGHQTVRQTPRCSQSLWATRLPAHTGSHFPQPHCRCYAARVKVTS